MTDTMEYDFSFRSLEVIIPKTYFIGQIVPYK